MTMEGSGIVPVMDVNRNVYGYGDGFGCGGGWFMWIIVLFALMGGWGNGFGRGYGNGPGLTQVEMQALLKTVLQCRTAAAKLTATSTQYVMKMRRTLAAS